MTKDERQEVAVEIWKMSKGLGGFNYPTGFGKMYITINKIIYKMLEKRKNKYDTSLKVIIVVDTTALKVEWVNKIREFIKINNIENLDFLVQVINTFQERRIQYTCDLLVLDEVSKYFSIDRQNIWNGKWVKTKYLLWLDATPKDRFKRDVNFIKMYPMVDYISPEEAIEEGWITKSHIYNIPIELNKEEEASYIKAEEYIDKHFSKLDKSFYNVTGCLSGVIIRNELNEIEEEIDAYEFCCRLATKNGWHHSYNKFIAEGFPNNYSEDDKEYVKSIINVYSPEKMMHYAAAVMQGIRKRLDIIYLAKNKIKAVLDIIEFYKDKYCIIFTQRTEMCSLICSAINNRYGDIAVEYHSNVLSRPLKVNNLGQPTLIGGNEYDTVKTGKNKGNIKVYGKKIINALAIEHIRNKEAKIIVSGSGIDRGLDVKHISLGIICGFTQNSSQSVQRKGRLTRVDVDKEEAIYINLYAKNTVEEGYLATTQKEFSGVKYLNSLDELKIKGNNDI